MIEALLMATTAPPRDRTGVLLAGPGTIVTSHGTALWRIVGTAVTLYIQTTPALSSHSFRPLASLRLTEGGRPQATLVESASQKTLRTLIQTPLGRALDREGLLPCDVGRRCWTV